MRMQNFLQGTSRVPSCSGQPQASAAPAQGTHLKIMRHEDSGGQAADVVVGFAEIRDTYLLFMSPRDQ